MHKKKISLLALIVLLWPVLFSAPVLADSEGAGDVLRAVVPLTAFGMTFVNKDREGRGQFYKSFLSSTAVTYGLKKVIDQKGPQGQSESFPSGHAAMAFSGASFIQRRYGWKWGLPAYGVAAFVGWSRIDSDNHEMQDVVGGAVIGTICTYIFTTAYDDKLTVSPIVGSDTLGLRLEGRW